MLLGVKKIISYALIGFVVVSNTSFVLVVQAGGGPTLIIGSQTAINGDSISVPIAGTGFTTDPADITGLQFRVNYDNTLLSFTGFTSATTGVTTINDVGDYVSILWDHSSALVLDNETFVSLNFDVISDATVDANLNLSNEVASDSSGDPVIVAFVDGVISLNPDPVITLLGDAIVNLLIGDVYTDAGATASDNVDGDITANIVTVNSVNTAVIGTYTVTYNVSDVAGNAASQVSRTVFVSGGMLVISLTGAPEITLTVGDTYTELGATASDQIDGPLAVQITGSVDTTVIGDYTITYTATDDDNNTVTVSRTVHVVAATSDTTGTDTAIPTIGGGVISQVTEHSYNVAWSWSGDSTIQFSLKQSIDGALLNEVAQISAVPNQTDYQYTFDQLTPNTGYWFLIETVGNIGGDSGLGNTNPTITLASVPSNAQAVADSPTQITVSWSGNATTYAVSHRIAEFNGMNADVITNLTSQQFTDLTCNTEYTFSISAINSAGFYSAASAPALIFTQACPASGGSGGSGGGGDTPVTAFLISKPGARTNQTSATFSTGGEDVATYTYVLDEGESQGPFSTFEVIELTGLAEGSHTIAVTGIDALGNVQAIPTIYTWIIDITPAVVTISGVPTSPTNATTATLTIDGEDIVLYRFSFDGGAFGGDSPVGGVNLIETPLILEELTDGTHTVAVIGRDSAGNWQEEADAVTVSWVVDTLAPTLSATPVATPTNDATPEFTVTVEEGVVWEVLRGETVLASGTGTGAAQSVVLPELTDGIYTLTLDAHDAAGNRRLLMLETFVVDTASPVVVEPPPIAVESPPVVTPPQRGGGGGSAIIALSSSAPGGGGATLQTFPVAVTIPVVSAIAQEATVRTLTPQVLGVRVFSEGVLLRVDGHSIYIVRGRTLHSIPNADVLRRFANRDRLDVTAEDIAGYEIGNPIPAIQPSYNVPTLLRVNAHDIYIVDGRTLHRIPNPHTLWPYRDFTRLEVGDDALIEFAVGDSVPAL